MTQIKDITDGLLGHDGALPSAQTHDNTLDHNGEGMPKQAKNASAFGPDAETAKPIVRGPKDGVNWDGPHYSERILSDGEAACCPKGMHKAAWRPGIRYAFEQGGWTILGIAALSQPIALAEYGMAGQPGNGCTIRVP